MTEFPLEVLNTAFSTFGPYGLLLVLWWMDSRKREQMQAEHRDQVNLTLREHKAYMDELRSMYSNNVELVRNYATVAGDLKDLVVLNTQALTGLTRDVRENQFCPQLRIEKRNIQISEGQR